MRISIGWLAKSGWKIFTRPALKILQLGEHKCVFQLCILIMAMVFNRSGIVVLKVIEEEETVSCLIGRLMQAVFSIFEKRERVLENYKR